MRTQAVNGFAGFFSCSSAVAAKTDGERWKPITRAAPAEALVFKKSRRFTTDDVAMDIYLAFFGASLHPFEAQGRPALPVVVMAGLMNQAADVALPGCMVAARWMALR